MVKSLERKPNIDKMLQNTWHKAIHIKYEKRIIGVEKYEIYQKHLMSVRSIY